MKDLILILFNLFKIEEEAILPNTFYEAHITLIPKPGKENTKEKTIDPVSLMNRYKNPARKLNITVH